MEPDAEECQEIAVVVEAVTDILEILQEVQNPFRSLEILSASAAFILCNQLTSAKDADRAKELFIEILNRAMGKAEDLGATMWTRGTSH